MNNFDQAVATLKQEIEVLTQQYQAVQKIKEDNDIEQAKIIEQNLTIKHTIEDLQKFQADLDKKKDELDNREKQILLREKQKIFLDKKAIELQDRATELILGENKLKRDQEEYEKNNQILNKKSDIYKKLEETEIVNKTRLKLKEEQVDEELNRLKKMSV